MSRSMLRLFFACAVCLGWYSSSNNAIAQPCDDRAWYDDIIAGFYTNGVDGTIHATLVDSDGNFWVAGEFTSAEDVVAHNVAYFDGTNWYSPGAVDGPVYAITEFLGGIVIGGAFSVVDGVSVTNIASFNGTNWGPLSGGVNNTVRALHVYNNALIAGGDFSTAGSVGASRIAAFDGGQWNALGTGLVGASVATMAELNGALIVGGTFSLAGGTASQSIASWNGNSWSALDEGITGGGSVLALLPHSSGLFVGGAFDHVNELPGTQNLAHWNGNAWTGLTDQTGSTTAITSVVGVVNSLGLTTAEDFLVIGGDIAGVGGDQPEFLIHYNIVAPQRFFATPPVSVDGPVTLQTSFEGQRVFAGNFTNDGSTVFAGLAKEQNNGSWRSLSGAQNTGVLGTVTQIKRVSDVKFILVGDFSAVGDIVANNIAVYDFGNWSTLPGDFNGRINDVSYVGGEYFVGGEFTQIDGEEINRVARYKNGTWHAMESGANSAVFTIEATSPSNVYCGGDFTAIGSTSANRIARWDGNEWVALSSGMNARVNTIAINPDNDSYVLIGGAFTAASGIQSNSLAYWTADRWRAIGNGVEGIVYDISFVDDGVFVAVGEYTDMSINSNSILAGSVQSLQMIGGFAADGIGYTVSASDQILVGGSISSMIDCDVSNIARIDSTASAFGMGANDVVATSALFGDGWIVGGEFSAVGSSPSSRLAYIPACDVSFWVSGETQLCPGSQTTLTIEEDPSSPLDEAEIMWSNGATTASISVDAAGSFTATVIWPNGCQYTVSVDVTASDVVSTQIINFTNQGEPFEFCSGASITIGAPGFNSYVWSNNATTAVIDVTEPGEYWCSALDDRGCLVRSDTIVVEERPVPQQPEVVVEFITGGGNYLDQYFRCDVCEQYEDVRWFVDNTEVDISNLLELVHAGELDLGVDYEVYVIVTNEYGCSATSEVVVQSLTDVVDEQRGIVLAPHPVQDHVVVRGLSAQPTDVRIQTLTGAAVRTTWQNYGNDIRVDTQSIPAGTYSLVVTTSTETLRFTFVKL